MIYILWSITMLIPAYFILRSERTFDRRPVAAFYGLLIGLTGAGGQLVLFKALTIGPAYLIFPIIALSPGITVLMATFLLRERLLGLTKVGIVLALIALVFFNISGGSGDADVGPWLILALLITVAWGVQAYYMRKAASVGVNDGTTFGYMALCGLLLVPVAFVMMGGFPERRSLAGPDAHVRYAAFERGRRPLPRDGPEPWQGVDRGAHDQRPRAGADRSDLARRVSDAAVRLRRRRHRAGHSRLDAHGLRGREAWRGRRRENRPPSRPKHQTLPPEGARRTNRPLIANPGEGGILTGSPVVDGGRWVDWRSAGIVRAVPTPPVCATVNRSRIGGSFCVFAATAKPGFDN